LGASARGRAIAALFSATIPLGILASSGAKNDYVLTMWLAASAFFALRWRATRVPAHALWMGAALGLALFTKATAWLFAPCLLAAIVLRPLLSHPRQTLRALGVALAIAFAINAPLFTRNFDLSGSPMGFDSAQADGVYRWRNDTFGWKQTASNLLRNTADQLGARSPVWNQSVYEVVLRAHQWIGIDPNDPATTWHEARYAPPRNDNHEADAPDPWQIGALALAAAFLCAFALRGRNRLAAAYALALAAGFAFFCFYLKWQPYMGRLFLPLLVLGAPLVGLAASLEWPKPSLRAAQPWVLAALCLFFVDGARLPVLDNWVRPLKGPQSILHRARDEQYFADMGQFGSLEASYRSARDLLAQSGCGTIGIDASLFQLEYPLEALLREVRPDAQFVHTGVDNPSRKYAQPVAQPPCAIVCLECVGNASRMARYRGFGAETDLGGAVVFLSR
jgi:4-amino-4-deoxy-L-arabinose transferase-like glycosyltransferase